MMSSERVARALELYDLIWIASQPTESRYAEFDRLLRMMEVGERDRYYKEINRRYRCLTDAAIERDRLRDAIARAEEEITWE